MIKGKSSGFRASNMRHGGRDEKRAIGREGIERGSKRGENTFPGF